MVLGVAIELSTLMLAEAQEVKATRDTFPVPKARPELLFYIQRSTNINTIVYELNTLSNGRPDPKDPIHIFWIRYAEDGQQEELSHVQRHFAYGITTKLIRAGVWEITFVSYAKLKLYLKYSEADKRYYVYVQKTDKEIQLTKIFVKINGGTFWFPKVDYVELSGIDPVAGKKMIGTFKP